MSNLNLLVDRYLAGWNETNADRRRELIAKTWTEDATYTDAHRYSKGHAEISAMIETVQERFPGYRFRLAGKVEGHNDRVRFQWEVGGTKEAPLHIVGTDFGLVAQDGRLASITGFLDVIPAELMPKTMPEESVEQVV